MDLFYKRNGKFCFDVVMLFLVMSFFWWMVLLVKVWKMVLNVLSIVLLYGYIWIVDVIYIWFWYFVLIVRVFCLFLGVKILDEKICVIFGNLYFYCFENLIFFIVFIFDNIFCVYFLFYWNNWDILEWGNMYCICYFLNIVFKK